MVVDADARSGRARRAATPPAPTCCCRIIRDELRRRVHVTTLEGVEVVTAELGVWAGAIGAAVHGAEWGRHDDAGCRGRLVLEDRVVERPPDGRATALIEAVETDAVLPRRGAVHRPGLRRRPRPRLGRPRRDGRPRRPSTAWRARCLRHGVTSFLPTAVTRAARARCSVRRDGARVAACGTLPTARSRWASTSRARSWPRRVAARTTRPAARAGRRRRAPRSSRWSRACA